jgi:hypothetical protein
VFNPQKGDNTLVWELGGVALQAASRYTYLGLVFDAKKGLRPAPGPLVDAGRKALFGLMGICSQQEINDPALRHHMFKALVLPVLSYGSELWGGFTDTFTTDSYYAGAHAEKIHTMFLRWYTGAARSTHKRLLAQAAGTLPLGAHWDSRTFAFWNRLAAMSDNRLARLAFKDNITLMRQGGQCWASRAVEHFSELGALGPLAMDHPVIPLWNIKVSAEPGISECNDALWARYCYNPRALPPHPVHVAGRTLFTFACWFKQLTNGLQVHHNVPAQHWKRLLAFCTGRHVLASKAALWHRTPPHLCVCPCCGGAPEDEVHFVLECRAYAALRLQYPSLFADLPLEICTAMRHIFQPDNFRAVSRFLHACSHIRSDCLAGALLAPPPPPPQP